MFKNYLLIAYRNLLKNRIFSMVNIVGLSIGMVACLLICMYVNYERSYDTLYDGSEDIYRVRWERLAENGDLIQFASACPAVGQTLKETIPEVESYSRIYKASGIFSFKDKCFREENVFWAENEYLSMMTFNLVKGYRSEALVAENTVVISKKMAIKYFGDEDPMGKFLRLDNSMKLEVTGVFEDRPDNMHVKTDILISFPTFIRAYGPQLNSSWLYSGFYTYIKLLKGTDPSVVESRIPKMVTDKITPILEKYHLKMFFHLQKVNDIHLTSHYLHELQGNGDSKTISFLFIIAWFIIIIAWVNFINLSTISSLKRAKEVGLRKVVGATKGLIIWQFFMEALIINVVALFISGVVLELTMPLFSNLTGVSLAYNPWHQWWFYRNIIGMFVVGVFVSGLFPVWGLSSAKIISILSGDYRGSRKGLLLRKGLVFFQFAISLLLIAGTISVSRQLNHMRNADLGFSPSNVMVVNAPSVGDSTLLSRWETFRSDLLRNTGVEKVAYSSVVPGKALKQNLGTIYKEGDDPTNSKNCRLVRVDYDFIPLYDIKVIAGRNFSREFPSDNMAVVINEKTSHLLGFEDPQSAVGQRIVLGRPHVTIIGVVANYYHRCPKEEFDPEIFHIRPAAYGYFSVKLSDVGALKYVKECYVKTFEGNPFDYYFLRESYNQQYEDDMRFGDVFVIFALLGIVITCLGLMGLSAFTATQRRKEIGVRKVMGASVGQILMSFSREYIYLLVFAALVVMPVFYWGVTQWLDHFATQMDVAPWLFVIPLFVVGFIALATVSFQSYRTANMDPVKAIRYE